MKDELSFEKIYYNFFIKMIILFLLSLIFKEHILYNNLFTLLIASTSMQIIEIVMIYLFEEIDYRFVYIIETWLTTIVISGFEVHGILIYLIITFLFYTFCKKPHDKS